MLFKSCAQVNRKLSAYLDGELSPVEQAGVREHLGNCAGCAEELRRFSAADADIKRLSPVMPSPFFAARVSAAARAMGQSGASLRRFLSLPVPAMALMVSFILINLFTFAFNINAMENGPRRELARKIAAQLAKPASMLNPVALARLCGECNKYMCLCMHETGKKSLCPCKNCEMKKTQKLAGPPENTTTKNMEEHNAH